MTDDVRLPVPEARPEVSATASAHHGSLDYVELEELGLAPENVLDFSVNSNPFGPSPSVAAALARVPLDRYPDREALALRRALAEHLGVSPGQIVAGNGTAELIHLLALAFVRADDHVMIIGPTFGEYARACQLMGAQVKTWNANVADAFAVDREAVAYLLAVTQPRLLFVCRPNNPTGALLPLDTIAVWAQASPSTVVVVDEAYLAFAGARSCLGLHLPNVVALRSMTKDYALAGLRLGYAAGPERIIAALSAVRPAWNVNALAQAAGLAALGDQAHLQESLGLLRQATTDLVAGLRGLGLPPHPSHVHFFIINVGSAASFRRKLLMRGMQVRDCTSFGLPEFVRIAARRPHDNARLLNAICEVTE